MSRENKNVKTEISNTEDRDLSQLIADKTVILYGSSGFGRAINDLLESNNIVPKYFVDSFCQQSEFCSKPVISMDELLHLDKTNSNIVVVITSQWVNEILESLRMKGFDSEVLFIQNFYDGINWFLLTKEERKLFENNIRTVHNKLYDSFSKEIISLLYGTRTTAFATAFSAAFAISCKQSGKNQYFIKEVLSVLSRHENVAFIDCGAFTGDTIQEAFDLGVKFYNSVCFEPDVENFTALTERLETLGINDKVAAIQSGVWYMDGSLNFNAIGGLGSRITRGDSSDCSINVVSLDSFVKGRVDMIKMDIEGSELNALKGSLAVLKRERPILAISIYHKFHDITEIPLFLMENLDNYDFIIRQFSFDTVLYCLPQ